MGRNKTFDNQEVLSQAVLLFGQEGYSAVSIDVMLTALGLNRASFYKFYSSKQGLFHHALESLCVKTVEPTHSVKDFVLVALLELAPLDESIHQLALQAVNFYFKSTEDLGQALLNRANRLSQKENSHE